MRKHYLIISITCLIIAGLLTLCMGCATTSWPVKCRHTAEMCKMVVEEQGFKTRIVRGPTPTGTWHRQTQAWIKDKWEWLSTNGVEVYVGSQDFWFKPEIYLY